MKYDSKAESLTVMCQLQNIKIHKLCVNMVVTVIVMKCDYFFKNVLMHHVFATVMRHLFSQKSLNQV